MVLRSLVLAALVKLVSGSCESHHGHTCQGDDLESIFSPDIEHCCSACLAVVGCAASVFVVNTHSCLLKTACNKIEKHEHHVRLMPRANTSFPLSSNFEFQQCGRSTSFCPWSMPCCFNEFSPSTFGCSVLVDRGLLEVSRGCGEDLPARSGFVCCKMGPPDPPSKKLRNVLVIGDSISMSYAEKVSEQLADVAKVQRGPWDLVAGGAGNTAYGIACLDRFLVTQAQEAVKWDLIVFNFGGHDLANSAKCKVLYYYQLARIMKRLVSLNTKLLYILTTPSMPHLTQGNRIVETINVIASRVARDHRIPVMDLYATVTEVCGDVYTDCKICNSHPCNFHYDVEGHKVLANAVAKAISRELGVVHLNGTERETKSIKQETLHT
eukprot:TRINITY_DN66106_c0_g1_i1.p1 TRINITY_DN66106_c0_g1~~TRINITY_DN66106_c0_g1_i1.p1  ORF type:complete len:381 (-),score=24.16 TRINITY_DN66106_c0_g1_i1:137-1279(-)